MLDERGALKINVMPNVISAQFAGERIHQPTARCTQGASRRESTKSAPLVLSPRRGGGGRASLSPLEKRKPVCREGPSPLMLGQGCYLSPPEAGWFCAPRPRGGGRPTAGGRQCPLPARSRAPAPGPGASSVPRPGRSPVPRLWPASCPCPSQGLPSVTGLRAGPRRGLGARHPGGPRCTAQRSAGARAHARRHSGDVAPAPSG